MGAACCVAAKDGTHPGKPNVENLHANGRYYVTRRFHWDHPQHVAGEIGYSLPQLHEERLNMDAMIEMNGRSYSNRGKSSVVGSPSQNFERRSSRGSLSYEDLSLNPISPSDTSTPSRQFSEVKNSAETPEIGGTLQDKFPCSLRSSSSFSTPSAGPFYSRRQLVSASPIRSRLIQQSPGHQLFRQVSDGVIQGLKSPNNNSLSEGRSSFVLSTGSYGGSSDGWSLRTFSELVASSWRERWSFDSAHFGSGGGKISAPSSRFSSSPCLDPQNCGACMRPLAEKNYIFGPDMSVVSVLACAHAYHAECLETMTAEVDKFDPACPICAVGEKQFSKVSRKVLRAEAELKMKFHRSSRNRVMDSHFDGDINVSKHQKVYLSGGNLPRVDGSSSSKGSLGKQFFRRHFSLGSKWGGSTSGNRSGKKLAFLTKKLNT